MWVLEYPRNDKVISKWLHPNNSYQIGRINDPSEHEVHLNELYISKKHLVLSIGSVSLQDVTNAGLHTPLKITFQSKARTLVNGKVYQLNKIDPQPIEVDDFTQESELNFKFKSGTPLRMKLLWVPFNIGRLKANMRGDDTVQRDIIKDSLLQMFNKNIDIRIVQDFLLITHLVTPSDEKFWFGLGISLARAIPIVGMEWPQYVLNNTKNIEKWLYSSSILSALLLPTTSRSDLKYFVPNAKRSTLLQDKLVYSISLGDKSDYFNLLRKWVTALGGDAIDVSSFRGIAQVLAEINKNATGIDKFFVMESNNPSPEETALANQICQQLQCFAPINPSVLYDSVVSVNIGTLQAKKVEQSQVKDTPNEVSIKTESISPQKRRLGSKKNKKVDRLAFFDFSSIPTSQAQVQAEPPVQVLEAQPVLASHPEASGVQLLEEVTAILGDDFVHPDIAKKRKVEEEVNVEQSHKRAKTALEEPESVDNAKKHALLDDTEVPGTLQPEKKQKMVIEPKVTLKDAIFQTKSKATEAIRKELGIGSQEIDEHLNNLAIVELVDIPLRNREQQQQTSASLTWRGRKDFKKFKKNMALKSRVSRSFVDMDLFDVDAKAPGGSKSRAKVSISLTMKELLQQEERNRIQVTNLAKDFDGEIDNVNGFNPNDKADDEDSFSFRNSAPSQNLFVSEDSQVNDANTAKNSDTVRHKNHRYDSDDDSDDDDQLKFGFSRRY